MRRKRVQLWNSPWLTTLLLGLQAPLVEAVAGVDPVSVSVSPPLVTAGNGATGEVKLGSPAPAGGVQVDLSTSDASVATTPASVTVSQGQTIANFGINTFQVTQLTEVLIRATLADGTAATAPLRIEPDYPPFFDNPPHTLHMGGFTLSVLSYDSKSWDFSQNLMVETSGLATMTLNCGAAPVTFEVRFGGLRIQPIVQGVGQVLDGLAIYPSNADAGVPPELRVEIIGFHLAIAVFILEPTGAKVQAKLELPTLVDTSTPECKPATIDLGTIDFSPTCEFYKDLPAETFGPWTISPLGVEFSGQNIAVDFSTAQKVLGLPYYLPNSWRGVILRQGETIPRTIRGALISNTGYLKARYDFDHAAVQTNGLRADLRLKSSFTFQTLQPFGYEIDLEAGTLNLVDSWAQAGQFTKSGLFTPAPQIRLPESAVSALDTSGNPVPPTVRYTTLEVQPDLDLFAEVTVSGELLWGELFRSEAPSPLTAYSMRNPPVGHVYFSGGPRPTYFPVNSVDQFQNPVITTNDPAGWLEAHSVQGATFVGRHTTATTRFIVHTRDVPEVSGARPPLVGAITPESWFNVGAAGVHGHIEILEIENSIPVDLGPIDSPYYAEAPSMTKAPFVTHFEMRNTQQYGRYLMLFQFVDSALYYSDTKGYVTLGAAVGANIPFVEMQFTSTADNAGAKVMLPCPDPMVPDSDYLQLDHWKLDLVPDSCDDPAGVLSVRTGQMFLTAANIQEERHWEELFHLLWAELLANGEIGEILFDKNSSNQKFDGIDFTPHVISLSAYDLTPLTPTTAEEDYPFLQVAGTIHFDFFGNYYLDIRDSYYADSTNPDPMMFNPDTPAPSPYDGRRIALRSDGLAGADPSQTHIVGDWGGAFGSMEFDIDHDEGDQDGFTGAGSMGLLHIEGDLDATITLDRNRICMSVYDAGEPHDLTLGPVASFGVSARTSGCGCIVNNKLDRVHIQGELQSNAQDVVAIRAATYASYEMDLTPSTSEIWLHGNMFLNLVHGIADMEMDARAHFLVNRDDLFVEGDVEGKFKTSASMYPGAHNGASLGSVGGEGKLSWHAGVDGLYLQGRLGVEVVSPGTLLGGRMEGGFFAGVNAPVSKLWVLTSPEFPLGVQLPSHVTGVYTYGKFAASYNAYVLSGGFEVTAGAGFFHGGPITLNDACDAIPGVLGRSRVYLWGDFLGGLLSASASTSLEFYAQPCNPQFHGNLELEACALWVVCASVDIDVTLDKNGIDFDD